MGRPAPFSGTSRFKAPSRHQHSNGGVRRLHWLRVAWSAGAHAFCVVSMAAASSKPAAMMGRALGTTCQFAAAAMLCAFFPRALSVPLGLAAAASGGGVSRNIRLPSAVVRTTGWLAFLRRPMMCFAAMRVVMPVALPGTWRGIQAWQRSLPILTSYAITGARAKRLQRSGRSTEAEAVWHRQHSYAAEQMFQLLASVRGFYSKLGQILATKTDMLPAPYTASLSRLLDTMPPMSYQAVLRMLHRELGCPPRMLFDHIDPFPLASATIAQVHKARLALPGTSSQWVAVKLQHRGVRRMMRADLANMRCFVDVCDVLRMELGFDLGSVVREYQVAVPGEFRFDREAADMEAIRASLAARAAADMPELVQVVIPKAHVALCTPRLLVMELLDGVPLLHAASLDGGTKHAMMYALIRALGVQLLLDGLFHTDPHPGNLLACRSEDGSELRVGLLDFGQVKRLTAAERLRCARLVAALATRDRAVVRSVCRRLGIRIENCAPDFEEAAAYILFDTRMDLAEARQSPIDPDCNPGWKTTRVPRLPADLFMFMRIVTLLRGVLSSLEVWGVSSALAWEDMAQQVLAEAQYVEPPVDPPPGVADAPSERRLGNTLSARHRLVWMDAVHVGGKGDDGAALLQPSTGDAQTGSAGTEYRIGAEVVFTPATHEQASV